MAGLGASFVTAESLSRRTGMGGTGRPMLFVAGGSADFSQDSRRVRSFETIDCSAALAGGEPVAGSGGCSGGSDRSCTACVEFERGGRGGGTGLEAGADVGVCDADPDDDDASASCALPPGP